jgi:hypothetical protein
VLRLRRALGLHLAIVPSALTGPGAALARRCQVSALAGGTSRRSCFVGARPEAGADEPWRAGHGSLDRGPGGLRAKYRNRKGDEREWTVLGASRGEAGILGEGIRQALLRDPTYGPALDAANALAP